MAAEVSCLVQTMDGYKETTSKSTVPITQDLLGGSNLTTCDSKELDLDLHVPSGYEKRLDLKSGKVYLHECSSPPASSSQHMRKNHQTLTKLQDSNYPAATKQPLNLFDDTSLDLNLVQSSPASSSNYHSVCTLDKVKYALERAEKDSIRKRSISMSLLSSSSNLSSSSRSETKKIDYEENSSASFAAGCPSCLLYVLISMNNPRCPRCNMIVPSPMPLKKPRIDLNISI